MILGLVVLLHCCFLLLFNPQSAAMFSDNQGPQSFVPENGMA